MNTATVSGRKILSRVELNSIISFMNFCPPRKALDMIKERFSTIDGDTLWSIHQRWYEGKMITVHHRLRNPEYFKKHVYDRFWSSIDSGGADTLLKIADSIDIAPSLVARKFLEQHCLDENFQKQVHQVTSVRRKLLTTQREAPNVTSSIDPVKKAISSKYNYLSILAEYLATKQLRCEWVVEGSNSDGFQATLYIQDGATHFSFVTVAVELLEQALVDRKFSNKREAKYAVSYQYLNELRDCGKLGERISSILKYTETLMKDQQQIEENQKDKSDEDVLEEETDENNKDKEIPGRSEVKDWMRRPYRIPDRVLCQQVAVCIANDLTYGPIGDALGHTIGAEYEFKLEEALRNNNLLYKTENDLRAMGFDKTPDIKLDVPIAVDGKVVNWIESKARFADCKMHTNYLNTQLWSYWNRFGPGLVIYWFGYVDDVEDNSDKGILIRDEFPRNFTVMESAKFSF